MTTVNQATPVGARVQHVNTEDLGYLLGFDPNGDAEVSFDVDPDGRTDHLPPASLIEVAS